jgi:hypothetical protein
MEEPRPKRPKPTPSMAPDTDTVSGLRATIIENTVSGLRATIIEKEKEIKNLKIENDIMRAKDEMMDKRLQSMFDDDEAEYMHTMIIDKDKEIKKLKDSLEAATRNINGEQSIIEAKDKEIKELEDSLKAAHERIHGAKVTMESFQIRIHLMLEDFHNFARDRGGWNRGRVNRCRGVRSPPTVAGEEDDDSLQANVLQIGDRSSVASACLRGET